MRRVYAAVLAIALATPASPQAIRRDHQLHIGAGSLAYAGARTVGATPWQSVGVCALAGLAKEAYDATGRGTVEASDVAFTVLPCLILAVIEGAVRDTSNRPARREAINIDRARRDITNFQRSLR